MKILFTAPYFYPQTGGLESYVYHIAKGLKEKHGWRVVIVTSNHEEKKYKEEEIDGLKVYRLAPWLKVSNTPVNPLWFFQMRTIIKKEKPDLINAHAPVPFMADVSALAAGSIPLILTYHTGSMILKDNLLFDFLIKFYEKVILKSTLRNSVKIICSSDYVRLNFLKDYVARTATITPGVDLAMFKPGKTFAQNQILFVGGLKKAERYKGLEYLLQAVRIIKERRPGVQLSVVSDGDYRTNYERMVGKLGIEKNVVFEGRQYGSKLVKSYQRAGVFVLPSLFDSCPLAMLEAMACKKPVVGARASGIPYLIDDGKNGLLVSPKDPVALAQAISRLLNDSQLAKKMGEEGYKKVKRHYAWNNQVEITNRLLHSVLT